MPGDIVLGGDGIEGERIDEPAVHEHAAIERDRREERRQRYAGGNGSPQGVLGQDRLILGIIVGGHDLERDLEVGDVPRHTR